MTEPMALLEPTFSAAMTAIEDAADLTSLGLFAAADCQMAGPPG